MSGLGWAGTIVAPDVNIVCHDGSYNGNLYAKTYSGTCEGHWYPPIVPLGLDCLIDRKVKNYVDRVENDEIDDFWLDDFYKDDDYFDKDDDDDDGDDDDGGGDDDDDGDDDDGDDSHDCDFRLRYNSLTGTIPTQLGYLSKVNGEFVVNDNQLTGPVPSELGLFTLLSGFNIADNILICDDLPPEVIELAANDTDLETFDIAGTSLGTRCCDLLPDLYTCD
jgi:hypothetical protein